MLKAGISMQNDLCMGCRASLAVGDMANVYCKLDTKDLWEKFNELGTEMIITKSGRDKLTPGAVNYYPNILSGFEMRHEAIVWHQ
ncbi:hypothetical protein Ciccas_006102 [Cichlidogyrus casuarinus]|uniref:T-box domain-containing protein n=1 Tax=Cichlidogyrus casuarinus TaxID=1844966 RepID=A0ABD2Q969_9PLAT